MCLFGAKATGYSSKLHFLCCGSLSAFWFLMLHLWHFFVCFCLHNFWYGAESESRDEKDEMRGY